MPVLWFPIHKEREREREREKKKFTRNGSVVFAPTSHTDGRKFEPSTRSQPARLGGKVEQQDYAGP